MTALLTSFPFWLEIYLVAVNLLLLCLMGIDKGRAVRHRWRIPERVLLLVAAAGGAVGGIAGMLLFRHKTRHPKFYLGYPALLAVHLVLAWLLLAR